jgi:hypothetical protein
MPPSLGNQTVLYPALNSCFPWNLALRGQEERNGCEPARRRHFTPLRSLGRNLTRFRGQTGCLLRRSFKRMEVHLSQTLASVPPFFPNIPGMPRDSSTCYPYNHLFTVTDSLTQQHFLHLLWGMFDTPLIWLSCPLSPTFKNSRLGFTSSWERGLWHALWVHLYTSFSKEGLSFLVPIVPRTIQTADNTFFYTGYFDLNDLVNTRLFW